MIGHRILQVFIICCVALSFSACILTTAQAHHDSTIFLQSNNKDQSQDDSKQTDNNSPQDDSKQADNKDPQDDSTPTDNKAPQDDSKPTDNKDPQDDSKPTDNKDPQDDSKPTDNKDPQDDSKPTDNKAPQDDSKPTDNKPPQDDSKPTDNKDPQDDSKPTDNKDPQDDSKPTDNKDPQDDSKPTDNKAPQDDSKPTDNKDPQDDSKPTDNKAPQDDSKPTDNKDPQDDSKPTDNKAPQDIPKGSKASSAPTDLRIREQNDGKVIISWSVPENPGQYASQVAGIVEYRVYWKEGNSISTTAEYLVSTTSPAVISIQGLRRYSFIVVAKNTAGLLSPPSAVASVTTKSQYAPPSAPTKLQLSKITTSSFMLSWKAPESSGLTHTGKKADIIGYTIYWNVGETVDTNSQRKYVRKSEMSYIRGLKKDTAYSIVVVARNSNGQSKTSEIVRGKTKATQSGPRISNIKGDAFTISWTAPYPGTTAGGELARIIHYTVYWQEGDSVTLLSPNKMIVRDSSATITGLKGLTGYSVIVTATNNLHLSSLPSKQVHATTLSQKKPPNAPSVALSNIMNTYAILSWNPPNPGKTDQGDNARIASYSIYWKKGASIATTDTDIQKVQTSNTSYLLTGLEPGKTYSFIVAVTNSMGQSSRTKPKSFATPHIIPTETWDESKKNHDDLESNSKLTADMTSAAENDFRSRRKFTPIGSGTDSTKISR